MVHPRPALPAGHGELVARPAVDEWAALASKNHAAARGWSFQVADTPAADLRVMARSEALDAAERYSTRLHVPLAPLRGVDGLLVVTGHQPEFYHPGVWIKDFLLQRLSEEMDANAIDVVVDSDSFGTLGIGAPCFTPEVRRCESYLAVGSTESCFACSPVPSVNDITAFASGVETALASLPAPAVRRHFAEFARVLADARPDAENLADLTTIARRRYEVSAGSDYLELPVTWLSRTRSFAAYVAGIALSARRFAECYNAELLEYRRANGVRSAAQPFPDLAIEDGRIELPFWAITGSVRASVWAAPTTEGVRISSADGTLLAELPVSAADAVTSVAASPTLIAPKALALTSFTRMFMADLFIHGVGGGRYDRVADGVIRRYFGVEPLPFVVASITMYLPLGAHIVTGAEVSAAQERANRLEHNPDSALDDVDFDSTEEEAQARSLAAEKSALVAQIAEAGADKKVLGRRIREVNVELARMMAPVREEYLAEVERLKEQRDAAGILTERTYPYCFWSPQEIADKAR